MRDMLFAHFRQIRWNIVNSCSHNHLCRIQDKSKTKPSWDWSMNKSKRLRLGLKRFLTYSRSRLGPKRFKTKFKKVLDFRQSLRVWNKCRAQVQRYSGQILKSFESWSRPGPKRFKSKDVLDRIQKDCSPSQDWVYRGSNPSQN